MISVFNLTEIKDMHDSPQIILASEKMKRKNKERPFSLRNITIREIVRCLNMAYSVFIGKYDVLKWD